LDSATDGLYDRFQDRLEDFWGRRENEARFRLRFAILGCPVELSSNQEAVLSAAAFSTPLYSRAPDRPQPSFRIQIVVRQKSAIADPPPEQLFPLIEYTGAGEWLHLELGSWGECFVDLKSGDAVAILAQSLAAHPDLVSRCLLNTVLNNLLTRHGFAMLHTTALLRSERLLLLMAPHNSGKSTLALRLALSGEYRLISDSQVYLSSTDSGLQIGGFPVGLGKLRRDMVSEFPELAGFLSPEIVRDETKYIVDLRRFNPNMICETAQIAERIDLCFLTRTDEEYSLLVPASPAEAWPILVANSLHYDRRSIWLENLDRIAPLVAAAARFHLKIGRDVDQLRAVLAELDGNAGITSSTNSR